METSLPASGPGSGLRPVRDDTVLAMVSSRPSERQRARAGICNLDMGSGMDEIMAFTAEYREFQRI
jgi:hypothetical protein